MPETLTIRDDLIVVESFGVVTSEDLSASLREVFEQLKQGGPTRVYVDATRAEEYPDTFPLFEFGTDLAAMVRRLKFAVVCTPVVETKMRFLETVTTNRGLRVKLFPSEAEAMAWLSG